MSNAATSRSAPIAEGVARFTINSRLADRIEQVAVAGLNALLLARIWPHDLTAQSLLSLLLLVSEGAVLIFLLLRRPTDRISLKPGDWLLAAGGSFLPLLVSTGGAAISPTVGAALMLAGIAIHVGAKLSLNVSFGLVAANRGVKQAGLYTVVRHPMYAGYILTHIAFLLLQPSWWNLGIYGCNWVLLILRIRAEEKVLGMDERYRAFAARVPYRLIPGVY
ncbi:MAG: isoprenylcysteine carboxylmethyltransferase family protein [Acidobacteria bacterium]|nr:isoprenylcysteine carboxylmethyltransferase family protein [Acidobacteriota bacterium]